MRLREKGKAEDGGTNPLAIAPFSPSRPSRSGLGWWIASGVKAGRG